ncbi:MAG: flavodoxin family protein [Planctomycetaceae bacterium]
MRVLILYETRRGFTLTVSRAIRDELRSRGVDATAAPLRGTDRGTLAAADALVVGSWVQGMIVARVGPADGALAGIDVLPQLAGRPTVVFCTCDVAPRRTLDVLSDRLALRGANVLGRHTFKKRHLHPSENLEDVPAFVEGTLAAFAAAAAPTGV